MRTLGELAHFAAEQAAFDEVPAIRDQPPSPRSTRLGAGTTRSRPICSSPLAIADNGSGRRDEGRAELERATELETQLFGEHSWQVGLLLADLADTYPGSDPRGLELDRRALAIEESLLGVEPPATSPMPRWGSAAA